MLKYVVYGKIIIDTIKLLDGRIVHGVLGGGGPQGAFGARLWSDGVGFLSRSGADIEAAPVEMLHNLDIDVNGWEKYPDLFTMRGGMAYDKNGYMVGDDLVKIDPAARIENWNRMLSRPLALPPAYRQPRAIHLITEYHAEPMVKTALELRAQGAIFSLEPLIDYREWSNRDDILSLLRQVDIVTPDWPSASGISNSDKPRQVLKHWAALGPRLVAIRHAHHGSYVWDRDHDQMWHVPAVPVEVVDPTGAGNSYGGGLCVGWAETQSARGAGCYGAVSASFLVRRYGLPKMSPELQHEARAVLEQTLPSVRPL